MKLLIATTNPGKYQEISEIFGGLTIDLLNLAHLDEDTQVDENGTSYKENAQIKARHFFEKTGIPTIGEDSGIVVEALKDELGMHTRRWGAGAQASDEEWINHFMKVMKNHPDNRKAKFISHMYYIDSDNEYHVVGETHGVITDELEAPLYHGLPLSSCFRPDGLEKVYSALTEQQKNQVSHRGKAGKQMHDFLKQLLDD